METLRGRDFVPLTARDERTLNARRMRDLSEGISLAAANDSYERCRLIALARKKMTRPERRLFDENFDEHGEGEDYADSDLEDPFAP